LATLAGPVVSCKLIAITTLANMTVVCHDTDVCTVTSSIVPVTLCIYKQPQWRN